MLNVSLLLLLLTPAMAGAQDEWEFAFTPFLWGSGMDGTIGLGVRGLTHGLGTTSCIRGSPQPE